MNDEWENKKHKVINTSQVALQMNLPQEGFVRLPVVLQVLGIKKSYFWEQVKLGQFPKPIKMGEKISIWKVEDIRKLISKISNNQ